jgi:hypothetical protein
MTREIRVGGRRIRLPQDHRWRIALGVGLVAGGVLGFLPVLGFWMVPLGILVLSHDIPAIRRFRRRVGVWWERRRRRAAPSASPSPPQAQQDEPGAPEPQDGRRE